MKKEQAPNELLHLFNDIFKESNKDPGYAKYQVNEIRGINDDGTANKSHGRVLLMVTKKGDRKQHLQTVLISIKNGKLDYNTTRGPGFWFGSKNEFFMYLKDNTFSWSERSEQLQKEIKKHKHDHPEEYL